MCNIQEIQRLQQHKALVNELSCIPIPIERALNLFLFTALIGIFHLIYYWEVVHVALEINMLRERANM